MRLKVAVCDGDAVGALVPVAVDDRVGVAEAGGSGVNVLVPWGVVVAVAVGNAVAVAEGAGGRMAGCQLPVQSPNRTASKSWLSACADSAVRLIRPGSQVAEPMTGSNAS